MDICIDVGGLGRAGWGKAVMSYGFGIGGERGTRWEKEDWRASVDLFWFFLFYILSVYNGFFSFSR
jgi:hypothetical protein